MIYVFLAEGFEECEALAPVDILRRAGLEVKTVGVGNKEITGAHDITVVCDIADTEAVADNLTAVILPGGMPGTLNLEKSDIVQKFIDLAAERSLLIGAICAAPSILGHKGLLKNKKATCFTGFEKDLEGALVVNSPVVWDDNFITAYGAGAAMEFGFTLVAALLGEEKSETLKEQMRY